MFAARYFAPRAFAPRYFAKAGLDSTTTPVRVGWYHRFRRGQLPTVMWG